MLKCFLLSTAALALIATAADANPKVTLSADHHYVSVMPNAKSKVAPYIDPGSKWVYSTFAKGKEGSYFCCFGNTVSGPSSFLGAAYGVAEQFTLPASASITTLAAAVGWASGDHSVTLTLYADNGSNSPGTQLAQGTGTSNTQFGACCGVTKVSISSTKLSANTPYWIGITTTGANYNAAPFEVKDEVDDSIYIAGTSNGGTTWGAGVATVVESPAIGVK